jgi:hypothetical protein
VLPIVAVGVKPIATFFALWASAKADCVTEFPN